MSGLKNRKRSAAASEGVSLVINDINTKFSRGLIYIAKHFGNCPNVEQAKITDIYDSSFTLEWSYQPQPAEDEAGEATTEIGSTQEPNPEVEKTSPEMVTEDMTFASRTPLRTSTEIYSYISQLAEESQLSLGASVDNSLNSLSRDARMVAFRMPPITNVVLTLFGLGLNYYIATNPVYSENNYVLSFFNTYIIGQKTAWFIHKIAVAVHVSEAVVAYLLCKFSKTFFPAEINDQDTIKWVLGTLFLGINCLIPLSKRVFRAFKAHATQ
ncbi:hypothetical protein AYI68_g2098 [Smittium mucronatum]|uniref:DUF2470 domain-containing protein n=1 Tax=Smittium mucronatum TaxID=133383 RepID=A0A1R0H3P5_9FUNG|nr:hypothetical protein AYI68_g2098 [Smittium mucronatum]